MAKMPSLLIESMNVKLRQLSRDLSNTNAGTINIKIKAGNCDKVTLEPYHKDDEGNDNNQNNVGLNIETKKKLLQLIEERVREHNYFPYGHILVFFVYEDGHFTRAQIDFALETVMK